MIILNGIKYEDLQSMIRFMYNGEIRVEENELADLLATAETLQVKGLCNVRENSDKDVERTEELRDGEKSESDDVVSKDESIKLNTPDTEYQLECNNGHKEGERNPPKKRRKMSHTVVNTKVVIKSSLFCLHFT